MQRMWERLETIRQQPEFVRQRYLYGSVGAVMFFVLGLWLLSIQEGFRSITSSPDITTLKEQAMETLPQAPEAPSLSDMLENGKNIENTVASPSMTSENFFQQEMQMRESGSGEGAREVRPTAPGSLPGERSQ